MISFSQILLIHRNKLLISMKNDKCLLFAISKGELLSGKASGQFINKADAKYKQYDLNEKGEKTGKAFGYT